MPVNFKAGDRVVCVDASDRRELAAGNHYTVHQQKGLAVYLTNLPEEPFHASRFVPAAEEQPERTFGERQNDPDPRHFDQLMTQGRRLVDPDSTTGMIVTVPLPDPPKGNAKTASPNPKDLIGITKVQVGLFPSAGTILGALAMQDGAVKYGAYNWREHPVKMTVYLDALERHLLALRDGEDNAEDSGVAHLGHILSCAAIIADAQACGNLIDDRPMKGAASALLAMFKKPQVFKEGA